MESVENLIKHHGLRLTKQRLEVLGFIRAFKGAISQPMIEKGLSGNFDRVTIYRTLKSFLDSGLIHKVLDDDGGIKYALCHSECAPERHIDEHIHFKCRNCGITSCLDELSAQPYSAPKGYVFEETNILIQGLCPECKA